VQPRVEDPGSNTPSWAKERARCEATMEILRRVVAFLRDLHGRQTE
jgi:hypothetical protein